MKRYYLLIYLILCLLLGCCNPKDSVPATLHPTATSIPPIATQLSPTLSPLPPSPTPIIPTATALPPNPTPSAGTVLLIFGNRFIEDIYSVVRPALEEAGYEVLVASRTREPLQAKIALLQVEVDMLLEDVRVEDFDAILFTCDNDITFGSALPETNRIVQETIEQGKLLAAICSGPRVLAYADAVAGLTVTGERSQTCKMLEEAGADCTGERVEVDGLVITARDRYASQDFSQAVLDSLAAQSSNLHASESPNDLIVFYSERDGNPEIYTMKPDGSDPHRLTFNQFEDSSPVWSPDGSRIAFLSDRDDPEPGNCFPNCFYQLYVMNSDGGDEHKLVETDFSTLHPDWHPAGTRLSFDTEFNLVGDIYVINSDGSSLELLIEDGFWADWSPDGSQLVFASNRDGNVEIYIAEADGSNQQRLTENDRLDFFPAWSPDGSKIAFSNFADKQIYLMDPDGSNQQQLTFSGLNEDPAWSPDGSHIAFQSTRDGNFEIYTLNVAAVLSGDEEAVPQRLTNNSTGDFWPSWFSLSTSYDNTLAIDADLYLGQPPPGSEVEIFAPGFVSIEDGKEYKITISPDLSEIFFTRRTPNSRNDRIWYARVENGNLTMPELAPFTFDAMEVGPCFTPDGNRVYYNSWQPHPEDNSLSGRPNVWFVDRIENGWSEPQFLGNPINEYHPVYFSIADDGTLYFTRSNPREIWYAEQENGEYGEAQRLPDAINALRDVAHPAVAPDESYIIVDSVYQSGSGLVGGLYISFRREDGTWTEAVSMADVLKAAEADIYAIPRISPDGKYIFFEKYELETDQADIYWISAEVIESLREESLD